MNEVFLEAADNLSDLFLLWSVVLFYLSIKKCFLKGNQGKIKLFFLLLFANPTILRILSFFVMLPMRYTENVTELLRVFYVSLSSIVNILLLYLCSNRLGKWLGVYNRQLVTFVYLMFSILHVISTIPAPGVTDESWSFLGLVLLAVQLLLFVASILLYLYVIRALARLTDTRCALDRKLFIIPPSIFVLFYNVFNTDVGAWSDFDSLSSFLFALFSDILLFQFIWAFYVIIKNINATNEAIEAKDLAAEMARNEALREADLNIAKNIQLSALPSVFPPFPERKEFELFASMNAAKEVGGDFYDFYMLDDTTLGFLIADVSGKSIPGAMFMMTAKTVIKSLAESGMAPADVFTKANEKLCEGNEAEMFVTAWLGYLDLNTGLVRVANAGHNPPLLIHGGKAGYVILRPGLMLAGMDGVRYREQTVQLQKGDMLYLYTDGVTEAMDRDETLYGEDRLQKLLSFGENYPAACGQNGMVEPVCDAVLADVRRFTDGAEQSDDITMLCVRYLGND